MSPIKVEDCEGGAPLGLLGGGEVRPILLLEVLRGPSFEGQRVFLIVNFSYDEDSHVFVCRIVFYEGQERKIGFKGWS